MMNKIHILGQFTSRVGNGVVTVGGGVGWNKTKEGTCQVERPSKNGSSHREWWKYSSLTSRVGNGVGSYVGSRVGFWKQTRSYFQCIKFMQQTWWREEHLHPAWGSDWVQGLASQWAISNEINEEKTYWTIDCGPEATKAYTSYIHCWLFPGLRQKKATNRAELVRGLNRIINESESPPKLTSRVGLRVGYSVGCMIFECRSDSEFSTEVIFMRKGKKWSFSHSTRRRFDRGVGRNFCRSPVRANCRLNKCRNSSKVR